MLKKDFVLQSHTTGLEDHLYPRSAQTEDKNEKQYFINIPDIACTRGFCRYDKRA